MANVAKREWVYKGQPKSAWTVRFIDGLGVKRQNTFERKKDADAFARKIDDELDSGIYVSDRRTVGEIGEWFLRHSEERVLDGRIGHGQHRNIKQAFDRYILPKLGKIKMTDLTAQHVADFYSAIRRDGRLNPRSAKARVMVLKYIQDFALKRKLIASKPVDEALVDLRGIASAKIRTFSPEQVMRILETAEIPKGRKMTERRAALVSCVINIAAFCGLRIGEIRGLRLENISFKRGVILVRHNMTEWEVLKAPKTRAGVRDVPVPAHVLEMLQRWIARHYVVNELSLIFTHKNGRVLSAQAFGSDWRALLREASVVTGDEPGFHFHALRHFAASWMIDNGMPIMDVALLLGHSRFDMTLQTYAHPVIAPARQHEVVNRMATALLQKDAGRTLKILASEATATALLHPADATGTRPDASV